MTNKVIVKSAPGRLAPINFSRSGNITVSYHGERYEKAPSIKTLSDRKSERLALFHPNNLPPEIEAVFSEATALQGEDPRATSFRDDITEYCKAIGFASSLVLSRDLGEVHPLSACNIMIGDPEKSDQQVFTGCNFQFTAPEGEQRDFFGESYDQLVGRSVLTAPMGNPGQMGLFSLCLSISHEVGCIKLVEQAKRFGLKSEGISKEVEMFFSYAYSCNFNYLLIRLLMPEINKREISPDIENVLKNVQIQHRLAMENLDRLSQAERNLFMIMCDPRNRMNFGYSFSIDLVGKGQPALTTRRTPGYQ
jgi:hypothetical protein